MKELRFPPRSSSEMNLHFLLRFEVFVNISHARVSLERMDLCYTQFCLFVLGSCTDGFS